MFKINQTVWCVIYGKGVVENIHEAETYSIRVKFTDDVNATYTNEGKYHEKGNVTLFPYPVEIVKAATKPSIEWSHVNAHFKYLAMDDGGLHHLFVENLNLGRRSGQPTTFTTLQSTSPLSYLAPATGGTRL